MRHGQHSILLWKMPIIWPAGHPYLQRTIYAALTPRGGFTVTAGAVADVAMDSRALFDMQARPRFNPGESDDD